MTNVKLLFLGDVYYKSDPIGIFSEKILETFKEHNIVSCNFEGPVITSNSKEVNKAGSSLCQNKYLIKYLATNNVNLLNIANNHIGDYGKEGVENTLKIINECKISKVGADSVGNNVYKPTLLKVNGITVGFLAFAEAEFGVSKYSSKNWGFAWVNDFNVDEIISEFKKKVDFLIIQVHAGIEEIELPLPEWRERYKTLIEAGADMIIGHHPHVPQGWEVYKSKYIFYSLGNFIFENENGGFNSNGYMVSVLVNNAKSTKVDVQMVSNENNQVTVNNNGSVELKRLCNLISNKNYEHKIDRIALELWQSRYKQYYINAVGGDIGILTALSRFFKLEHTKINLTLLLHNIKIESHRWLVERALMLLSNK